MCGNAVPKIKLVYWNVKILDECYELFFDIFEIPIKRYFYELVLISLLLFHPATYVIQKRVAKNTSTVLPISL
jgi:hypothetical protein